MDTRGTRPTRPGRTPPAALIGRPTRSQAEQAQFARRPARSHQSVVPASDVIVCLANRPVKRHTADRLRRCGRCTRQDEGSGRGQRTSSGREGRRSEKGEDEGLAARRWWPVAGSGAAAHPAGQLVTGNAVLVTELLKLLELNVIGKNPQRFVSCLWVANVTQDLYHPLPAIRHPHHHSRLNLPRLPKSGRTATLTCVKFRASAPDNGRGAFSPCTAVYSAASQGPRSSMNMARRAGSAEGTRATAAATRICAARCG